VLRPLLCLLLFGPLTVVGLTPAEATKLAKLRAAPITLYPDFDIRGSRLPDFINTHGREKDAVVVSYRDAFKTAFRIAKVGVKRGGVWIYVNRDMRFRHEHWSNVEGAAGIVFIPDRSLGLVRRSVNLVAEDARAAMCVLAVGVASARTYQLADVDELCPPAQIFTIYDNDRLRLGSEVYRKFVEWLAIEARTVNAKIKIEVGIATAHDEPSTREVAQALWACGDLVDRIAIYCEDSPESYSSLATFYWLLRGGGDITATNEKRAASSATK